MRDDLPESIRRELNHQRSDFIRWCGARFEELIAKGIDPAPWVARVVQSFEAEAEEDDRAA